MKRISILLLITFIASCSGKKDDGPVSLDISVSDWYLTRLNNGGGTVNLKLEGSTNADKVTVRTFGDGLVSDRKLGLDSRNNFNEDVVISFTATSVPSGEFETSTKIMAYRYLDTLVVILNSGKLKY